LHLRDGCQQPEVIPLQFKDAQESGQKGKEIEANPDPFLSGVECYASQGVDFFYEIKTYKQLLTIQILETNDLFTDVNEATFND
jgi:hypothetical protein